MNNYNYCINCGKNGHNNKECSEPIISCGIICFMIDNIPIKNIERYLFNKYIEIEEYNYKNLNYIDKIDLNNNNIKFLLIQRRHSFSFVDFMRGKYDKKNIEKLKKIFSLMSKDEVLDIKLNTFEYLWEKLWLKKINTHQKEFIISKNKFNYLKNNNIIDDFNTDYDYPEWGFPKGRRNRYENNIQCANREFIEESSLNKYTLFHRLNHIEETFIGSNNVSYKNIYYIAGTDENQINKIENMIYDTFEIGKIGWFSLNEILKLLRPYDLSKIDLINQLNYFLMIIKEKIISKERTYIKIN